MIKEVLHNALTCLGLLTMFLLHTPMTMAQQDRDIMVSNTNKYQMEPELSRIADEIQQNLKATGNMDKCDTLYELGIQYTDKQAQALALYLKVCVASAWKSTSYDEMKERLSDVGQFSASTNQMHFYYKAWYSVISALIRRGRLNLASHELQQMMSEISDNQEDESIIDCYQLACLLAEKENKDEQAFEYASRALDKTLELKLDTFNLHQNYIKVASMALLTKHFDRARRCIDSSYLYCKSDIDLLSTYVVETEYYMHQRDTDSLIRFVKEIKDRDAMSADSGKTAHIWAIYHTFRHHVGKAKQALGIAYNAGAFGEQRYYRDMSKLMSAEGHWQEAYKYVYKSDSLRQLRDKQRSAKSIEEFKVLFDLHELNHVNSQLEHSLLQRRMINMYVIAVALILVLSILAISLRKQALKNAKLEKQNKMITEQSELLRIEKNKALASNEMKKAFIRNICHEVRTPMNAINGFTEVIAQEVGDNEKLTPLVKIVKSNTFDLLTIVDEMLEVSNMESDVSEIKKEEFDLAEMARDAIRKYSADLAEGVELRYDGEESVMCFNEKHSVELMINTLLSNAVKFTKEGHVEIHVEPKLIWIEDTGCGIPESRRKWVFEQFVKLHEFEKGVGLGLNICRLAADRIGAVVDYDNNYHFGTKFIINL